MDSRLKFTPWEALELKDSAREYLTRWTKRMLEGKDDEHIAPFFSAKTLEDVKDILGQFYEISESRNGGDEKLGAAEKKVLDTKHVRSKLLPYDHNKRVLYGYWEPIPTTQTDMSELLQEAVSFWLNEHSVARSVRGRLRRMTIDKVVDEGRVVMTTQAGMPWMLKWRKYDIEKDLDGNPTILKLVSDHSPLYINRAKDMEKDLTHPGWSDPCVLTYVTTGRPSKKDEYFNRNIWMAPGAVTLCGKTVTEVVVDAFRGSEGFAGIVNQPYTDDKIFESMRFAERMSLHDVDFDATAWGPNFPHQLAAAAFDALIELFQSSEKDFIAKIRDWTFNSAIITPEGITITPRQKGLPDGGPFTYLINNIANQLAHIAKAIYSGVPKNELVSLLRHWEFMGDDGSTVEPSYMLDKSEKYFGELGLIVNTVKSGQQDRERVYLNRAYKLNYTTGKYPHTQVVANGMLPHSPVTNGEEYSVSVIQGLANCYDPDDEETWKRIVDKWIEGDASYGLGSKLPGGTRELILRAGGIKYLNIKSGDIGWEGAGRVTLGNETNVGYRKTVEHINSKA